MHGPTYSRSEYGIQNTERIPLQALEGIPIPPVLNRVIAQAEAAGRSGTEAASVFDKSSGLLSLRSFASLDAWYTDYSTVVSTRVLVVVVMPSLEPSSWSCEDTIVRIHTKRSSLQTPGVLHQTPHVFNRSFSSLSLVFLFPFLHHFPIPVLKRPPFSDLNAPRTTRTQLAAVGCRAELGWPCLRAASLSTTPWSL